MQRPLLPLKKIAKYEILWTKSQLQQKSIVMRNGKIVWNLDWFEYYLRLNVSSWKYQLVPRLPQNTTNVDNESTGK